MLTEYIDKAMRLAKYELIEDGTYGGSIPGFEGVWANEPTLEACRDELKFVLEEWLVLGLWLNDDKLPVLGKLSLVPRKLPRKHGSDLPPRTRKAS